MPQKQLCATLAVLCAAMLGSGLQAASVEDAKKLLAAGKSGEVDAALGSLLTDKGGDPAALRVSFDAAMADGRLLTAQARIGALLKSGVKEPELLWKAARLAESLGEDSVSLSRFLGFVRAVPGADERTGYALRYLLTRGSYPEECQRLLKVLGSGAEAVAIGLRQVELLLDAGDAAPAMALARSVIAAADAPHLVSAVHLALWNAAEKNRTGTDARYLGPLKVLLAGGKPDRMDLIANMGDRAFRGTDKQSAEERAELLIAIAEGTKGPLGWEVRQHFGLVRQLKDEDRRLAWGKRFLATAANYPTQDDQLAIVQTICEGPEIFLIKGKELVPADDLVRRLGAMAKDRADLGHWGFPRVYATLEPAKRIELVRNHPAIASAEAAAECIAYLGKDKAAEADALIQACAKIQGPGWLANCNGQATHRWADLKDAARHLAAVRNHIAFYPGEWGVDHFIAHCLNRDLGTPAERLAPFRELAERGGAANPRLKELLAKLDGDKANWSGKPHFEEFKKAVAAANDGKDAACRALITLFNLPVNQGAPDPAYYATAKALADSLQQVPSGDAARDIAILRVAHRHIEMVWNNRDAVVAAADLWLPHFGKGSATWWIPFVRRLHEYGAGDQLAKHLDAYGKLVVANPADSNGDVWYRFAHAQNPPDDKRNRMEGLEALAGGWVVARYLTVQPGLPMPQIFAGIAKSFDDKRLLNDVDFTWQMIGWVSDRSSTEVKPPVELVRAAWAWYTKLSETRGRVEGDIEYRILAMLARSGQMGEPAGQELLKSWRAFRPERRSAAVAANVLTGLVGLMPRDQDANALKPGCNIHFAFSEVLPALEAVRDADAPGWYVNGGLTGAYWQWRQWPATAAPARASAERLTAAIIRLVRAGANANDVGWDLCHLADQQLGAALAAKDWPAAFDLARIVGRHAPRDSGQLDALQQWGMNENLKQMKALGAIELGFRYSDLIARTKDLGKDKADQWSAFRSEFARQMPELGVDRNDPFYDLQQAQRSLQLGNEVRAWQLSQPKLKLLQERWQDLDQNYVAWAAEQLRRQKLSKQTLEFCMTLLLREADFDPEIAGRIILTKGDTYLDLQNNPAARIEYEGLRNNRRYRDLEAGTKARYRLINLLIATNDYAKADEQLAQLVESERSEVQAEGWFLRARLAYEQKEWDNAAKALDECFKRSLEHVEGRLLQGELRLRISGGLASTEVEAGLATLGTMIIPGQPFTLKLQDTNLAISQGNASIPVVVRTSKGGDEERINLSPAPSQRSLFTATIPAQLGKVMKGDLTLQVRGDDEVTYQIAPEFQKAHGISYQPKSLVVRYAAKLIASAGELVDEDEQRRRDQELHERAMRNEVTAREFGRDPRTIRPGSPIYVQVTDLAADISEQPDTLTVDARTTGGSEVTGVVLTETGPHTGIFRGQLATAVPGARVAASDSEEGRDPAQLIVAENQQIWSSLPDGKRPKWLEVDTMASTLVSSAGIELPDPKAIRTVRLLGRQFGEYSQLAVWPKAAVGGRGGISAEIFQGIDLAGKPVRSERQDSIDFGTGGREVVKGLAENFSVRWSGTFVPAFSEEYTISTESDDGIRLWLDDKLVLSNWTGHGPTIDSAKVRLVAGKPQPFKLEYFQGVGGYRINLRWASPSQPEQIIPAKAFIANAVDSERRRTVGGIATVTIPGSLGADPSLLSLREAFAEAATLEPSYRADPVFDRATTAAKDRAGWQLGRSEGLFALAEAGEYEFGFTHQPEPGASQVAWLVIDQSPVTGGIMGDSAKARTGKVKLAQGVHRLELFVQDNAAKSVATIGYRKAGQGELRPLPAEWFSWAKHPLLAEGVVPAVINADAKGLTASFPQPLRMRSLRWVFEDFAGNAVQVKSLAVSDAVAGAILPAKAVAGAAGDGKSLLVAPGEFTEVLYANLRRLREDEALISTRLNSSFANGNIAICDELVATNPDNGRRDIVRRPVRRCRVGDVLQIIISDSDLDLTAERDQVKVAVETSSGEKLELTALETSLDRPTEAALGKHAGTFATVLKIGNKTAGDTIGIKAGDLITVTYADSENTTPGVPCDRSFTVETAGSDEPIFAIYRTAIRSVPDDSPEGRARAERLRLRGKAVDSAALLKDVVEAVHPDRLAGKPADGAPVVVDVGAPLLFEVRWPSAALNTGSELLVEAIAASELAKAKAEGREAEWTKVPATITPVAQLAGEKGFEARVDRAVATEKALLQEGIFAGILRFQLGSPGDPVDELVVRRGSLVGNWQTESERNRNRLPTIVVKGSETVQLRIRTTPAAAPPKRKKSKGGAEEAPVETTAPIVAKEWTAQVQLRSDGRLDLLDESYAVPTPQIHLGDAFRIQVKDPDRDTSDNRDEIQVEVRTAAGTAVKRTLKETLAHSGIFNAPLKPAYAGEAKVPAPAQPGAADPSADEGPVVQVNFGDELTFTYSDPTGLAGDKATVVTAKGRIAYGADGELAGFTKRFNDPDMAVKTQFLIAEALFEMAKEHRLVKQEASQKLANDEIARGKRVLEEALRDYPNTSLVSQGEFLLANLAEELADQFGEADADKRTASLNEAETRYATVINRWPDSEFAPRAQFKIALCQEKRGNFDQASESYVRVIYLYPENDLAADATLRLGNYYYKQKRYDIAAKVFAQFQAQRPLHAKAAQSLFLAAQSFIKAYEVKLGDKPSESMARTLAGELQPTVELLDLLIKQYPDAKDVRPVAMYWLGDVHIKMNRFKDAYRAFKKLTWDYPESKEAKMARGRLTEKAFDKIEDDK